MPYTILPPEWIEAGKPTKEEIFQNLKDNQESFNTDIEALKQTSTIDIFDFMVSGFISQYSSGDLTNFFPTFRAPVSGTITQVLLTLLTSSTSGNLQIQLDKSTDNGVNWNPLFTTPVEISGTSTGSISGAVSFISPALQLYNQNDLLRVRVVGVQVNQGSFHISVYGELT